MEDKMLTIESKKNKLNLKTGDLKSQFAELDRQFHEMLKDLNQDPTYEDNRLSTYNPLQIVCGFEQRGLQKMKEVSKEDMMSNSEGLRKLLANMLAQCRPGVLTNEDMEQLSGINGREMRHMV